jgi:hypothetical protein
MGLPNSHSGDQVIVKASISSQFANDFPDERDCQILDRRIALPHRAVCFAENALWSLSICDYAKLAGLIVKFEFHLTYVDYKGLSGGGSSLKRTALRVKFSANREKYREILGKSAPGDVAAKRIPLTTWALEWAERVKTPN